jgi:tRNA(adenine34) deaminase
MWSDLSLPWQAAFEMAWEAACCGSIPIGAAIFDAQGRLVAAGRNRLNEPAFHEIPGSAARQDLAPGHGCHGAAQAAYLSGSRIAHAEVNALIALDHSPANPRECTLYTTCEPCPMCAGAILMANVRHVCFGSRDPWAGSTCLYSGKDYMGSKHMRVEGPPGADFEDVLVALQFDYFFDEGLRRGPGTILDRRGPFFNAFEAVVPRGVALGERLNQSGLLRTLRAQRTPPGETIDLLAQELAALSGEPCRRYTHE